MLTGQVPFQVDDVTTHDDVEEEMRSLRIRLPFDAFRELTLHAVQQGLGLDELLLRSLALHKAVWQDSQETLHISRGAEHRVLRVEKLGG